MTDSIRVLVLTQTPMPEPLLVTHDSRASHGGDAGKTGQCWAGDQSPMHHKNRKKVQAAQEFRQRNRRHPHTSNRRTRMRRLWNSLAVF